jgi:antitoxin ParD1/3/4
MIGITMPSIERLSITLTPEMAGQVRDAVQTGQYTSNSEVIRDALRRWQTERTINSLDVNYLRAMWQEGIESGEPVDGRAVFDRLEKKYQTQVDSL